MTVGLRRRSTFHEESTSIKGLRVDLLGHVVGDRIGPMVGSVLQHAEQIQLPTGSWHDVMAKLSTALPICVIAIIKTMATRTGNRALAGENPKEPKDPFHGPGDRTKIHGKLDGRNDRAMPD